jgi:hypothetical protein
MPWTLEAAAAGAWANEVIDGRFAQYVTTLARQLRQLARMMGGIEVSKTNLGGAVNARRTRGRAGLELRLAAGRVRR